jgi:D-alanyl-lipoteichoic acid acyltransferase DltB (MBOAT superfamily)
MKIREQKSVIATIGVVLILLAVLSRRIVARNLNMDSLLSFVAGFAVVVVGYIIFKKLLNNRKD